MWSLQVFTEGTGPPVLYRTYWGSDIFRRPDVTASGRTLWGANTAPVSPQVLEASACVFVFIHTHVESAPRTKPLAVVCIAKPRPRSIPKHRWHASPPGPLNASSMREMFVDLVGLLLVSPSCLGFVAQLTGTGIVPALQLWMRRPAKNRLWSYIREI